MTTHFFLQFFLVFKINVNLYLGAAFILLL